jgi:hypothetical protein
MADDRTEKLSRVARDLESHPYYRWASGRALASPDLFPGRPDPSPRTLANICDDPDYSDLFEPRGNSAGAAYVGPVTQAKAFYKRNGVETFPYEEPQGTRQQFDVGHRRNKKHPVGPAIHRRGWPVQMGVAAIGTVVGFALVMLWDRRYDVLLGLMALGIALLPGAEHFFHSR